MQRTDSQLCRSQPEALKDAQAVVSLVRKPFSDTTKEYDPAPVAISKNHTNRHVTASIMPRMPRQASARDMPAAERRTLMMCDCRHTAGQLRTRPGA
eukprot:3108139-Rhodomonas_salina.1